MTMCTCSTLQAPGPGPKSVKCEVFSAPPDQTTARTDGLLTGFIVTRPDTVFGETVNVSFSLPNVPNVALNLSEA